MRLHYSGRLKMDPEKNVDFATSFYCYNFSFSTFTNLILPQLINLGLVTSFSWTVVKICRSKLEGAGVPAIHMCYLVLFFYVSHFKLLKMGNNYRRKFCSNLALYSTKLAECFVHLLGMPIDCPGGSHSIIDSTYVIGVWSKNGNAFMVFESN